MTGHVMSVWPFTLIGGRQRQGKMHDRSPQVQITLIGVLRAVARRKVYADQVSVLIWLRYKKIVIPVPYGADQ